MSESDKKTPECVRRFDAGELSKPQKLANGWLRVDGYLTRTGVFSYRKPDGTQRRELRLPEEVFKADVLESFSMVPLTDEHPPVGFLDSTNAGQFSKGAIEAPRREGKYMRARMLVTDADLIRVLEAREKTELSCGYSCELEAESGVYEGERYDCIQRNIRGNHVAIVTKGRAGPEVRMRLDSSDAAMVESEVIAEVTTPKVLSGAKMIKLDGVEVEVSEVVEKHIASLKADLDKASARADGLAEEVKAAQITLVEASNPAKITALVNARVSLVSKASKVLGDEFKADGLSETEIKLAVLAKTSPEFKAEGKSEDYITARFDMAVEKAETHNDGLAAARVAVTDSSVSVPAVDPRARMIDDLKKLYKAKQ